MGTLERRRDLSLAFCAFFRAHRSALEDGDLLAVAEDFSISAASVLSLGGSSLMMMAGFFRSEDFLGEEDSF